MEIHKERRDQVAALEAALADQLRKDGHKVLGVHPRLRPFDKAKFSRVYRLVMEKIS